MSIPKKEILTERFISWYVWLPQFSYNFIHMALCLKAKPTTPTSYPRSEELPESEDDPNFPPESAE